jgi:ribonuclease HI
LHGLIKFEFKTSNNEVKYDALIVGLKLARELHAEHIEICSDSQLVVNQVSREYEAWGRK